MIYKKLGTLSVSIVQRVRASSFLKNVTTLALGTIIGQLILIGATPILTRIYSAKDFGILALFTSVSTIAAILTTGRYEFAIGLPEKDEDAINIIGLIVFLATLISSFFLLCIFFIRTLDISPASYRGFVNSPAIFMAPLCTFLSAVYTSLQYWHQRKKKYTKISFSNTLQVLGGTLFNLLYGLIGIGLFGLIYGFIVGQLFSIIVLLSSLYKSGYLKKINIKSFKSKAKEYSTFPRYMILSDLSSTSSQQMIPIIFSILFNNSVVGFFALSNRMLRIPSIILTSSIGNVFRNDAIDAIRLNGNCRDLYAATLKKLLLLCVPIYLFLAITSPFLFSFFFGKNWVQSGYFAQIICIMMIFDFLALPLNSLFYVLEKQKIYMRVQVVNTLLGILSIYLGYFFFRNAYYSVLFFALNNALFSILSLSITYGLSKQTY